MTPSIKHISMSGVAAALTLFSLTSCEHSSEAKTMKKEVSEAVQATKDWSVAQWNDFHNESTRRAEQIGQKIDELQDKLEQQGEAAQDELQEQLNRARLELDGLRANLDRWSDAAKESWSDARGKIAEATRSLSESLDQAAAKLGGKQSKSNEAER
jgi:ABC-type phosphate transport system auxiliary subunit